MRKVQPMTVITVKSWYANNVITEDAIKAGYDGWFISDSGERVLAKGRVTDASA